MKRKFWLGAFITITCLSLLAMPLPSRAAPLPGSRAQVNSSCDIDPTQDSCTNPSGGSPVAPGASGEGNSGSLVDAPAGPTISVPGALSPNAGFPPAAPTFPDPADAEVGTPIDTKHTNSVHLKAVVSDTDSPTLTVSYYGRPYCPNPDFSLAVLPDTQYYSQNIDNRIQIFDAQTQWIVDNRTPWNIAYTTHLGDLVETWDDTTQWANANEAMTRLETGSMPFGLTVGNHDLSKPGDDTTYFNLTFPYTRFTNQPYYGGHYGSDNDNNYGLFSSGGMDFIIIHLQYSNSATYDPAILTWADNLLMDPDNSSRRAIIIFHYLISDDGTALSSDAQAVYNKLKHNSNLFLMLGGHSDIKVQLTLEGTGHPIYAIQSDYQGEPNGGNGWLRLMQFQPSTNQIQVYTYSPYLNQSLTDISNQFSLTYTMGGPACSAFSLIGTLNNVASGSRPKIDWNNLNFSTKYEWYVTVSDGTYTVSGPLWSFTTESPSAIGLVGLNATSTPVGVQLDWETAQEIDLLGFNVFRADGTNEARSLLSPQLIPAANPGQLQGNPYQFIDSTAVAGRTYYYWVEWLGNSGSQLFGPLSVSSPFWLWLPIGSK